MDIGAQIAFSGFSGHEKSLFSLSLAYYTQHVSNIVKKVAMSLDGGYNNGRKEACHAGDTRRGRAIRWRAGVHQTKIILEMIKFEHTVFMLPFALMAAVVASRHDWLQFCAQGSLDTAGDGRRALGRDGL